MDEPKNPLAFPLHGGDADRYDSELGMTLRDYFAAKIVVALISQRSIIDFEQMAKDNGVDIDEAIARSAYDMADVMLAARDEAAS